MDLLPTGTVTFLFTDIEGSTNLARRFPDIWPAIEARHRALMEKAIFSHQGYIFREIGDELNAAFQTAVDALEAALAAQRALNAEDWGEIGTFRVRMGLHTGPAAPQAGDYEGYLTLSFAKRLMACASGGQVLVSEAASALLHEPLPQEISLRDLGEHRLKDFERSEHVYQVVAPGLPADFPTLKSIGGTPNNLPVQLTSFVGRAKEMDEVRQLLSQSRLLTLTGPGGSGKTRLALQIAGEMTATFEDGVFFVPLASITDPGLVPSAISQSLSIPEAPGRSLVDRLKDFLRTKSLLLVLDNFEQVISAASLVADLLAACHKFKLIVTSREGLRVSGESEYPVPPLALPDLTESSAPDSLSQFASIELFYQRARAVRPDFLITVETAPAIVEICRRLDGLPLAIELAAARVRLLPPRAMLARIEHRLEFLTGGPRDMPARQQTLRGAIAWSYDLLDEKDRILFCRLAVFVGGLTLEAAEAVAGDDPLSGFMLDQIGSLLDKSLLQESGSANGSPRFRILETLREYGLEQLEASGEKDVLFHRHASFFLELSEQGEARLESAEQVEWINRMEREHANLRAALDWSRTAPGAAELCLRLAGSLGLFWEARGYISEGRERLAAILALDAADERTSARAKVLSRAAELAYRQSDYGATSTFAGESLAIFREMGDRPGCAAALLKLGNAAVEVGDYAAAARYLEEALALWRALQDQHGIARALISYGWAALRNGDFALAQERLSEALGLSRAAGDTRRIGFELSGLGEVALRQGDTRRAAQLVEESLELRRQLGNQWGVGVSLGILGWVAIREKDWDLAVERLDESLAVRREIGDQSGSAWCLERLAGVALEKGQAEQAAHLFAAGAALRESVHAVIDPVDRPEYERSLAALREELGEQPFQAAWAKGRSLSLNQWGQGSSSWWL